MANDFRPSHGNTILDNAGASRVWLDEVFQHLGNYMYVLHLSDLCWDHLTTIYRPTSSVKAEILMKKLMKKKAIKKKVMKKLMMQ
jgi:hypothetical protein